MNRYIVLVLLSSFLIVSCGNKKDTEQGAEQGEQQEVAAKQSVPEIMTFDASVQEQIGEWEAWELFNEEMTKFQKLQADNLSLSLDELIRLMEELEKSEFPEKLQIPAIKSRLLVLKTFILKTRSVSDDQGRDKELNNLQVAVVTAYNELEAQMGESFREKAYEKVLQTIDSIDQKIENTKNQNEEPE